MLWCLLVSAHLCCTQVPYTKLSHTGQSQHVHRLFETQDTWALTNKVKSDIFHILEIGTDKGAVSGWPGLLCQIWGIGVGTCVKPSCRSKGKIQTVVFEISDCWCWDLRGYCTAVPIIFRGAGGGCGDKRYLVSHLSIRCKDGQSQIGLWQGGKKKQK